MVRVLVCPTLRDGSACLSHTKTKSETTQGDKPVYEDKWIEFIDAESTALPLRHDQVFIIFYFQIDGKCPLM